MIIKLLSWNINMYNPDKPELQNDIINEINNQLTDEDFVILIESSFEFISNLMKTNIKNNYKLFNSFAISHGGLINILSNKKISDIKHFPLENPSLLINFKKDKKNVYLAGCHLFPFVENAERRFQELLIIKSMVPDNSNFIVIGDLNIREKETKFLEKDNILELRDSGDKRKTWFRSFFEPGTPISSRFDRLLISKNIQIKDFNLIGRKYLNQKMTLLSDHLGIKCKLEII